MRLTTNSPEETKNLAHALARFLHPGDILCLHGDLGAGKTHFAKGVAAGLGVEAHVTSPTFTLINEYQGRFPFYHIDAYRLEETDEAYELGLEEYFYGEGITLIEWPSRILTLLPEEHLDIIIERHDQDDCARNIQFRGHGNRYTSLVRELTKQCMC